jgi:hypothetical protein
VFLHLISMLDLTKEERAEAAAQGWGLFQIYDLDKCRWHMNILPLSIGSHATVSQAQAHVINQARARHPLSVKALQLMSQYNAGKK